VREGDKDVINTGFLANGGREWNKRNCTCDPDVGYQPCEYCATHQALETAERNLGELVTAQEKIVVLKGKLMEAPGITEKDLYGDL